jgi:DNA-directed RNA polymerase
MFVEENRDFIFDSADLPLDGKRWWLNAEDPWQCLATCIELAAAMRSPVPEDYMSHLHVHLDGSCNGLQHYAALGGDLEGGREVNLLPSNKPQDVYTSVAAIVNSLIEKDAETQDIAKMLAGKVDRKIVKQTVMTNVYGVTFIGARSQVEDKLIDRPDIDEQIRGRASIYITKKVFQSLRQMFSVAREIQDWITETAKEISRSLSANPSKDSIADAAVVWTTPLGLPIVQPYRKKTRRQIRTLMQTVFIEENDPSRPVDVSRQCSALAPNFIHSLDASHMLLTAHACYNAGITFASVHDSYWSHAATIDEMNRLIRDKFVELHQNPIMENLRNEFLQRYGTRVLLCKSRNGTKIYRPINIRPLPKRGQLDLNLVKDSPFFFD